MLTRQALLEGDFEAVTGKKRVFVFFFFVRDESINERILG